ncbi:MAG: nucleotidyltransferase domain-containing protein [Caldilineaceae bacterium]|nr:nucleotidyltransferase domain-containing protein [Caldilineaceae bacterium]
MATLGIPKHLAQLPTEEANTIRRAIEILLGAGCREVYLFGSLARGKATAVSDLDLAIRGCPKGQFFELLGTLLVELDRSVDLVDLDAIDPFSQQLETTGELQRLV